MPSGRSTNGLTSPTIQLPAGRSRSPPGSAVDACRHGAVGATAQRLEATARVRRKRLDLTGIANGLPADVGEAGTPPMSADHVAPSGRAGDGSATTVSPGALHHACQPVGRAERVGVSSRTANSDGFTGA